MAHYTITIKTLLNNNFDFKMTSYPIFDENYRSTLNEKILNHYYENEIGFETAPLFRFYLNNKLNEIMPKYNVLYNAQKKLLDENILFNNTNVTETLQGSNTTETESTSSSTNNSKNLFQDTPQGQISNTDINNQTWATNLNLNNSSISDTNTASGNGTNEYIKTIVGNTGGKYNIEVLNDIVNNFLNIDLMIINELNDLFMQIF